MDLLRTTCHRCHMIDVVEVISEGGNRFYLDPYVYDDGVIALHKHESRFFFSIATLPTAVWVGPMQDPNGRVQPLYRPHWNECIRRTGRKKNGDERRATKEFRLAKEAWELRKAERHAHRPSWERRSEEPCSDTSPTTSRSAVPAV